MEKEQFFNILIVIGILLILLSPLFLIPRIFEGRHFCKSINGTHHIVFNGTQTCNNKVITKFYNSLEKKVYWDFSDSLKVNLSNYK